MKRVKRIQKENRREGEWRNGDILWGRPLWGGNIWIEAWMMGKKDCCANSWRKSIQSRGKRKCKNTKVETSLVLSHNKKVEKISVSRVEWTRSRDKVEEVGGAPIMQELVDRSKKSVLLDVSGKVFSEFWSRNNTTWCSVLRIRVERQVRKSVQSQVDLPIEVMVDTEKIKQIWDIFNRQSQQDLPIDSLDVGYEEERKNYKYFIGFEPEQ